MAMSLLPLVAALLAVPQFLPQLARLRRTGDATGVSCAWATLTSVNNGAWTAYFALSRLWTALAPSVSATLLAGILAVWLARQGELPWRAALSITGWAALLAVAGGVFGRAALGTALAASFILQTAPSVWKAYRSERVSGISAGTWLLILGELLCWGIYGTYEQDPRLMVLGWTGVAASLLILTRVAAQGRSRTLDRGAVSDQPAHRHSIHIPRAAARPTALPSTAPASTSGSSPVPSDRRTWRPRRGSLLMSGVQHLVRPRERRKPAGRFPDDALTRAIRTAPTASSPPAATSASQYGAPGAQRDGPSGSPAMSVGYAENSRR